MKKSKIILFMLVMITMIVPNFVNAMTEEEAYAELEKLPFKVVDGDEYYFETKIVDPDVMMGEQCLYTDKDYDERFSQDDGLSSNEWIKEMTNSCKAFYYGDIIKLYLKYLGYDARLDFDFDNPDKNKAVFRQEFISEYGTDYFEVYINISYLTNVDSKELKKSKQILAKFEEDDRLYGLQLVNLMYHYGKMEDADYRKDTIFARYPKFKKIMEKNPEYQYVSSGGRGGGDNLTRQRVIQAGMFKDDIMYGVKQLDHYEEQILFVDKDSKGNLKEKVESRLNEYFNNKVDIKVEIENGYTVNDDYIPGWFNNYVNELLGTKKLDVTGYYSTININGKELYFVVAEVPKKYVDKLYVEAHDGKTGVNVKTDSYDVPLDVRVNAKDVKNDKKIKEKFDKENLIIDSAYDMSLTKSFDGTFVNKIDKGIEVYFPVDEKYKVGDKHSVYYVSNETNEKEEYDGEVVEIDDKYYVKFITNHFSTYVLASEMIDNPATIDNLTSYILLGFISLIGLITISIYLTRKDRRAN